MTAMEALEKLINDREYYTSLDPTEKAKIRSYKSMYLKGKIKHIDTILENHGYVKVKEPSWEKKKIEK